MGACVKDERTQAILRWVSLGVAILSWIFATVAVFGCEFYVFSVDGFSDKAYLGFFAAREEDGNCAAYSNEVSEGLNDDGAFAAGRAFAVLAFIAVLLTALSLIAVQLFVGNNKAVRIMWLLIRIGFSVSLVCALLLFAAFGAEDCKDFQEADGIDCEAGSSAILAILNIFLLIFLTVVIFLVPPPESPIFVRGSPEVNPTPKTDAKEPSEGTSENGEVEIHTVHTPSVMSGTRVTETTEIDPDGMIRTVRTTTHPDGSQTIEETIQDAGTVVE